MLNHLLLSSHSWRGNVGGQEEERRGGGQRGGQYENNPTIDILLFISNVICFELLMRKRND